MIIFEFFIGFFVLFLSPQIYLYIRYPQCKYSLLLSYGFILSLSLSWILFLIFFYFKFSHTFIYSLMIVVFLFSLFDVYRHREKVKFSSTTSLIWLLALALIFPLLQYSTSGFISLDAVCSWHRWALELFNNEYHPIDAAYPIFLPSMWSLIYKIQGTSDIWWTAQITLGIIPLMLLVILFSLYYESKNKSFIFMSILVYPYLLSGWTINGFMDMPVMMMGTFSLVLIYTAETYKGKPEFEYYIYASLLIAGIATIIKQSGLAFLVFNFIYIILHIHLFKNRRILFIFIAFSLAYFSSFLMMYYFYSDYGAFDNIHHLKKLSSKHLSSDISQTFSSLWNVFFLNPKDTFWFSQFFNSFTLHPISPYLIGIGLSLFAFKSIRKNSSVSILSAIFFLVSLIAWALYFSYDARNSFWVKSFFIIFISINISHFINHYIRIKTVFLMLIFFILSLCTYSIFLDDDFAYSKQKEFQTKIGDEKIAKYTKYLLENKDPCTKIYTNDQYLQFNYYTTQNVKNNLIIDRRYGLKALDSIEHSCKDGRYFIFRNITRTYPEWWKVLKLTKDGIIQRISTKDFIYFIPPNIKLKNDYFSIRTDFLTKDIKSYKTNLKYSIDKVEEQKDYFSIKGWAFIETTEIDTSVKYIVLKNDTHTYVIETKVNNRPDVTKYFKVKDLNTSGFTAYLFKKDFSKGKYAMYILTEEKNKQQYFIKTDKTIVFK